MCYKKYLILASDLVVKDATPKRQVTHSDIHEHLQHREQDTG